MYLRTREGQLLYVVAETTTSYIAKDKCGKAEEILKEAVLFLTDTLLQNFDQAIY